MISCDRGISGQLAGVSLSAFLQMIEMEQKTCTIKVFTKKNMGQIFFLEGTLIDSNTVNLKHLDALYDILSWNDIVIEVKKNNEKKQNLINLPLMHILIESVQHSDEKDKTTPENSSKNITDATVKNIRGQIQKKNNFCLEIGINLLIDFHGLAASFQSTLVGIEHGRYLLLKAPGPFGRIDHDLFNVEEVIIKSLYKGTIYAFRSKLISIISKPSKLMFIEYPKQIEHHELRLHKRFKCNIVSATEVNKKERGGTIKNISMGGCLYVIEAFSADENFAEDLLNDTLPFRCQFPGSDGEVRFQGEIRNTRKKSDEIFMGIQFIFPDTPNDLQDTIQHYIQLIEYSSENV